MKFVEVKELPIQATKKSEERLLVEAFKEANIVAALVEGVSESQYYRNRTAQKLRTAGKDFNIKVVTRDSKLYLINLELSNGKY